MIWFSTGFWGAWNLMSTLFRGSKETEDNVESWLLLVVDY